MNRYQQNIRQIVIWVKANKCFLHGHGHPPLHFGIGAFGQNPILLYLNQNSNFMGNRQ